MSWLVGGLVSFASGLLGALGMGAGTVLLLYLRLWGGMGQLEAQGVNLLFFLPIALVSLVLHTRHHLVEWKIALGGFLSGLPFVFLGAWVGKWLGTAWLGKGFAVLLLIIGIRELILGFGKKGR